MVEMTIRAWLKAEFSFNSTPHNSKLMQMFGSTFDRIGRYYGTGTWGLASDGNHTSHIGFNGAISCHLDDERLMQELPEILALLPLLPNVMITLEKAGAKDKTNDRKVPSLDMAYGDETKAVFEPMVRSFLSLERYSVTLKMGTLTSEAVIAAEGTDSGVADDGRETQTPVPAEGNVPAVVTLDGLPAGHAQLDVLNRPVRELDLSLRLQNCLVNEGLEYVGDILQKYESPKEMLKKIPNFGKVMLEELNQRVLAPVSMHVGQRLEGWTRPASE